MRRIHFVDPPRALCTAALGKDHTTVHRLTAGAIIMVAGVAVAKFGGDAIGWHWAHFPCDVIGYALHGMGALPYIEWALADEAVAAAAVVAFPELDGEDSLAD